MAEELGNRLGAALLYQGATNQKLEAGFKMVGEKQDQMLGKQDDTIAGIREVSEKIERGKEDIVTEIKGLREDLRSYMENKFAKIEYEIEGIKAKIGMV